MSVIYQPGEEPEELKARLNAFFKRINRYYPDREIYAIHTAHKKLGERLTELYRELGYESGQAMMEAYGYTYLRGKMKVYSPAKHEQDKREFLRMAREKVGSMPDCLTASELMKRFPELREGIMMLPVSKQELLNAGVLATHAQMLEACLRSLSELLAQKRIKYRFRKIADLKRAVPEAEPILSKMSRLSICQTLSLRNYLCSNGILEDYSSNEQIAALIQKLRAASYLKGVKLPFPSYESLDSTLTDEKATLRQLEENLKGQYSLIEVLIGYGLVKDDSAAAPGSGNPAQALPYTFTPDKKDLQRLHLHLLTDTMQSSDFCMAHYLFGSSPSDFRNQFAAYAPQGDIGRALQTVGDFFRQLPEEKRTAGQLPDTLSYETSVSLRKAADVLGYDSVEDMLEAYGYHIPYLPREIVQPE